MRQQRTIKREAFPGHLAVVLADLGEQIAKLDMHLGKARPYYIAIGQRWYEFSDDPSVGRGDIARLRPHLLRSVQWLNRCRVIYDAHRTGDLAKAELWARHNYHVRHGDEPYRTAEIIEAYRNRLRPSRPKRSPIALSVGRLCAPSRKLTFDHGVALLGDCHRLLSSIPDNTVDLVLTDPPFGLWTATSGSYGKTRHAWDKPLDWDALWPKLWRVLKPAGTIAICAAEPLASILTAAQVNNFLFRWLWLRRPTDIFSARHARPLKYTEPIVVFSRAGHSERTYHPEMRPLPRPYDRLIPVGDKLLGELTSAPGTGRHITYAASPPGDLIEASYGPDDTDGGRRYMHTQKPVALIRYLIRTHSSPGDLVLDIAAGSMTTAVAAVREQRRFLVIEQEPNHYALGVRRLGDASKTPAAA